MATDRPAAGPARTPRPDRWLSVAALLVLLWPVAFLRAFSRVFVLNFSTAGPNATGLLSLLLVTGPVLPAFARIADDPRAWHAALAVGLAGLVGSLAGGTLLALAGALVFLLATTPHLVAAVDHLGERFALAAGVGLLAHHALRVGLDTAPPYATTGGRVAVLGLGAALAAAWWLATRGEDASGDGGRAGTDGGTDGATVTGPAGAVPGRAALAAPAATAVAFLFAETAFLGLPARVALWADRPYLPVLVASTAGLLAGVTLVARGRGARTPTSVVVAALVFVLSLAALLFPGGTVPGLAALPGQAAAVVLLAAGSRVGGRDPSPDTLPTGTGPTVEGAARGPPGSTTRTAGAVTLVQAAGLVFCFLAVSAANWAFVPGVGQLVRDRGGAVLLALGALLPVVVSLRVRPGTRAGDRLGVGDGDGSGALGAGDGTAAVSGARRLLLTATGAGLLGLAGAGYQETRPFEDLVNRSVTPEAVTVLSFNVHQYLDSDGDHNLDAVRDAVAGTGAGIVGLQETDGGRLTAGGLDGVRWLAHELGYHHAAGPGTRAASYGVGLLSRWPIRDARVVQLPNDDTAPRVALGAVVESPLGDLPVVVAHTEVAGDVRVAQARRVVELARETGDIERAVLLGDFNTTPDERPYEVLAREFTDPWADSGPAGYTFSASDPVRRIDYTFTGSAWTARRGEVVGSPDVSDHLGVSATIREG